MIKDSFIEEPKYERRSRTEGSRTDTSLQELSRRLSYGASSEPLSLIDYLCGESHRPSMDLQPQVVEAPTDRKALRQLEAVLLQRMGEFFGLTFSSVRDMLIRRRQYLAEGRRRIKLNWRQVGRECGLSAQQAARCLERLEAMHLDRWSVQELEAIRAAIIELAAARHATRRQLARRVEERLRLRQQYNKQGKQLTNFMDYEIRKALAARTQG